MTERMLGVLRLLDREARPMTNNEIGMMLGFRWKPGTGGAPANRVNFAVTRLEHLGLVTFRRRPDGMSGSSYQITPQGRKEIT